MGLLSAELLAELLGEKRVHFALELELALDDDGDPIIYRYGLQSLASDARGLFEARITNWTPLVRTVSDRSMNLSGDAQTTVTIADADQAISKLIAGESARRVRGGAARILLVSNFVSDSSWFTVFDGIIDRYEMVSTVPSWAFTLRTNDRRLTGNLNIPPITMIDFPRAGPEALGQPGQVVYGQHDSQGLSDKGLVPTHRVDQNAFKYYISIGRILSLDRIYKDGNLQGAGPTLAYEIINGTVYSLVTFGSDQLESVITVDVHGLTEQPDTTGTLITGPVLQLEHALNNWIFGAWRNAAVWISGSPYVDNPSFVFANSFILREQLVGNVVLTGAQTGAEVVNQFSQNWQMPAFWTNSGKLAVKPDDFRLADPYPGDWPWIRAERQEVKALKWGVSVDSLADEIVLNHAYSAADGKQYRSLRVSDPVAGHDITLTLNQTWF